MMIAEPIHAVLIHLSYNMWGDWERPEAASPYYNRKPYLRFDDSLWTDILGASAKAGINAIVLDLGDGIKYESHPEIAVENAWSRSRVSEELKRMRGMGIEPIAKLNFSTAHDAWLGIYKRMVSTPKYYEVCRDLIAEVADIFDNPRLFHIGMDEELAKNQTKFEYAVVRQFDLWWRDLLFYVDEVEKHGGRAWMWADYVWDHPELFYARMPKKILQSNWYYGKDFTLENAAMKAYVEIEQHGYDQVPTLANWHTIENIYGTVEFSKKHIAAERLKGFLLAPWRPTLEECRPRHMEAIEHFGRALRGEPMPTTKPST